MKQCKHCGSRYLQGKGQGEFCCAGCEHVYAMIRESGLGDYYVWQDRAGRPVGLYHSLAVDHVSINQLQKQAENAPVCKIAVGVQGMSCLGCAWLIEQLARRHQGVLSSRVALNSNRLALEWKRGDFDFCQLADELGQFGYRITSDAGALGRVISPLAMRLLLTLVFSLNGMLLSLAAVAGIGPAGLYQLYNLLIAACLVFAQLIGGSLFFGPAWRGLLLRRLHSDAVPALVLLILFVLALSSLFSPGRMLFASLYFILLPAMVFARWLAEVWALKRQA